MDDRPDTRPEIEPYFWDSNDLKWPVQGKTKPDLIIFDPPYFKKQAGNYDKEAISGLSKENYLEFLENFFCAGTPKCQKEHTDGTYQRRLARFSKHTCKK